MAEARKKTYRKLRNVPNKVVQNIVEKFEIFDILDEEYLRRYTRLEQAYYYFLDNYVYSQKKRKEKFKECTKYEFFCKAHKLDPINWYYEVDVLQCFNAFVRFREKLPSYGAIILSANTEEIVMIQGANERLWSFPKGKIEFDETPVDCAIREVYEEIGFDISDHIDENLYIQKSIKGKKWRFYIIKDFPRNIEFYVSNPFEIAKVEWVSLDYLFKAKFRDFPKTRSCLYSVCELKRKKKKYGLLRQPNEDNLEAKMKGLSM